MSRPFRPHLFVAALALAGQATSAGVDARASADAAAAARWGMVASLETGTDYRDKACRDEDDSDARRDGSAAPMPADGRLPADRCAAFKWAPIGIAAGALVVGAALATGGANGSRSTLPPTPSPN
jgi:hypothetical protein